MDTIERWDNNSSKPLPNGAIPVSYEDIGKLITLKKQWDYSNPEFTGTHVSVETGILYQYDNGHWYTIPQSQEKQVSKTRQIAQVSTASMNLPTPVSVEIGGMKIDLPESQVKTLLANAANQAIFADADIEGLRRIIGIAKDRGHNPKIRF